MLCFKCEKDINSTGKYLTCCECSNHFHVECIEEITDSDYDFMISSNVSWKCSICKSSKKHDDKPVTPLSERKLALTGTESPKNCKVCNKGFSFNAHRATCNKCKSVFHFKCVSLIKEEYNFKYGKTQDWSCHDCNRKPDLRQQRIARQSQADKQSAARDKQAAVAATASQQTSGDVTILSILEEMRSFRAEVAETHRELTDNMTKHSDWVGELSSKIDNVVKQVTDFTTEISAMKQENLNLKKQVTELMTKVNNLEQETKQNTLEIRGVPYKNDENLMDLLKQMGNAVNFDFNVNMIDKCFRYKVNNQPGGIVVRFVRKIDLDKLLELRKKKKNFNSRDIGFMEGNATVIYFNESLTQARRKLLNAAKVVKREKHYTFLWVRNGRIFMRKNEGDPAVEIRAEEDLEKLN